MKWEFSEESLSLRFFRDSLSGWIISPLGG